MLRKFPGKDRT